MNDGTKSTNQENENERAPYRILRRSPRKRRRPEEVDNQGTTLKRKVENFIDRETVEAVVDRIIEYDEGKDEFKVNWHGYGIEEAT